MPKVLYVEDDPALAELARRRLLKLGYDVLLADEGEQVLALVIEERPDVIILDIDLGKFSPDGFQINRRIKDHPSIRSIPVIALTAHADAVEYKDRAEQEGFAGYLVKSKGFDLKLKELIESLDLGGAKS